jgi:WD40 repeat protein
VVLARLPSIASEPLRHIDTEDGEEEEESPPAPLTDEVIRTFEEHEDSVYSAVWSCADAWVFASLSYDGRLVINHVPTQEKFTILTS